ncbi:organic cation/carnitine transporter 7-like [Papaver somniferum]|uniref:organic cation/carnitine transporter 7-like n=1 Tax=Papaver somniferum TaxID=3469 RepID=UPI000E6FF674|nr:organic cation/carnitine transporter 7-like [Papaver somniferum]
MGGGGEGASYTVDDALTKMGFGTFQALVLAYAGMGQAAEAMEMMLLSFVGPAVQAEWGLSSRQESMITSVVFAGMLVGAYTWGIVSDNHGRRKGFLITAICTFSAGFLSALAPNYISLIFLRCLVGVGLGGGPVLSSWFLEFIPAANRGTWMVIFSTFWTLGTVLEASLAWLVMPTLGWRWLLGMSSFPTLFLLIFYKFTPESPRYFCTKGRIDEALSILEKISRLNGAELPSGKLVSDHMYELELDEKSNPSEDTLLLSPTKRNDSPIASPKNKVSSETQGGLSSLLLLLSPELVRSTLLLWIVFFGNAFSYYGLVLLTSELSTQNSQCDPTSLHSGNSPTTNNNLYLDVLITSFAEFPGLLLAAAIVDRIGRKLSMSTMFFICCIFLFPLMFHQPENLTTALLFGARICITGTFTVVYIYAPEIYPTSIRTTGVGVASSVGRIGGIICPMVAVGLIHGCHQTLAIFLFEVVVFLAGTAVVFFPFETKGRELTNNSVISPSSSSSKSNISL